MVRNNRPKISVIVPVYNVEKYLPQCLDSLILQVYDNLEIICVNDGSKDSSLKILQEYAKKDARIKVINQKNGGASVARNRGVKEATGEWISFVDSDDWISLLLYQKFVDDINKCEKNIDMYIFNGFHFGAIEKKEFNCVLPFWNLHYWRNSGKSCIHKFEDYIDPFIGIIAQYLKIHRAEWYKQNDFKFLDGVIFEDVLFNIQTGLKAENIYIKNDWMYYYRENASSVMHRINKNVTDIFKVLEMVKQELVKNGVYEKMKYIFFNEQYRQFFDKLKSCPPEIKAEFLQKAKEALSATLPDLDKNVYIKAVDIFKYYYLMALKV
jgi:glycosyltransferase involved in cell wall biosynthesis